AEIEISFSADLAVAKDDAESGGHSAQRHPRARDERLQEHVPRAHLRPVAARRGMETGLDQRSPGLDVTGDAGAELALGPKRHDSSLRMLLVSLLQRRLQGLELVRTHQY